MKSRLRTSKRFQAVVTVCAATVSWTALLGTPLSAGVLLDLETIDHSGPEPRALTSALAIDNGRLKMDLVSDAEGGLNHSMIFRSGEEREILIVNHNRKTFQAMAPEAVATLGSEMRLALSDALQEVESLPPEQRAVVMRMLDSQLGVAESRPKLPPSTVLRTSERATHQGYACIQHDVFRQGERIREVWVTPWSTVPGSREALTTLHEMSNFYGEMMATFKRLAARSFGGSLSLDPYLFEELQQIDGFPILTRNFERGSLATEIVLRSIRQQELDPSELKPPEDYRQTAIGPN